MMTCSDYRTPRCGAQRRPLLALAVMAAGAAFLAASCASADAQRREHGYGVRKGLAREFVRRGDYEKAFPHLDVMHRERPDDPEVLAMRGYVYRERGLWDAAEADLVEALELAPDYAYAHSILAILYDLRRRPEDAELHHRRALELDEKNAAYMNNLGFSLALQGRYEDAVPLYQEAARMAPADGRIRNNLGFARAAQGDMRAAAHEFEMGGTASQAKNNLGFAYERRGNMAQAYRLYSQALQLDPTMERAWANLRHAAVATGRPFPSRTTPPAADKSGGEE